VYLRGGALALLLLLLLLLLLPASCRGAGRVSGRIGGADGGGSGGGLDRGGPGQCTLLAAQQLVEHSNHIQELLGAADQ